MTSVLFLYGELISMKRGDMGQSDDASDELCLGGELWHSGHTVEIGLLLTEGYLGLQKKRDQT